MVIPTINTSYNLKNHVIWKRWPPPALICFDGFITSSKCSYLHTIQHYAYCSYKPTEYRIWVNLITTSLFSLTGIMVYVREIIPKWPQDSGRWNIIIYPDRITREIMTKSLLEATSETMRVGRVDSPQSEATTRSLIKSLALGFHIWRCLMCVISNYIGW